MHAERTRWSAEDLVQYLTTVAKLSDKSCEHFVLKHGVPMRRDGGALPEGVRRGTLKMCFKNAWDVVSENEDRFVYCEGYAVGAAIPVLHAWVLDVRTGLVVDNTWEEGEAYHGVPIRTDYLLSAMSQATHYGLIDNWFDGHPIRRHHPARWLDKRFAKGAAA